MSPFVALREVHKSFGSTQALAGVSLDLRGGEVHVLAGANGAGKSTLLRILSGVYAPDAGSMVVAGRPRRFRGPLEAQRAGIATIHQELSLCGPMSVTDNLLLGEPGSPLGWLRPRERREAARRLLAAMELDVDPDAAVESLPLAGRQLVEIARALGRDARLVVMDEPTSALGDADSERLFTRIDGLRARGCAVLYVSHRMEEIYRLADRISVLRDGALVRTAAPSELPREQLIEAIAGRRIEPGESASVARGDVLLSVQGLSVSRGKRVLLADLSLEVRAGEIVGLVGLSGSGADVVAHAVFGARAARGTVRVAGEALSRSPRRCIERGLILVEGDRRASLVPSLGVVANATLSSLPRLSRFGFLRGETAAALPAIERLRVVCASLSAPVASLSGGNQQKVAFARCLVAGPRVLLLDEPTRGIDVGARDEVHRLLRELQHKGVALLLGSSDLDETLALADRLVVLSRGRVVARFERAAFDRQAVLAAALGSAA